MQRGELYLHAMCLGEGSSQLLERDVRFGLHDFQQKRPVRRELAELTSRATLRLGNRLAMIAMLCCKSHRRRGAHAEKPPR